MELSNTLFGNDINRQSSPAHGKLAVLEYFPQPIFLLSKDLRVIEKNSQAERALDNHWVGEVHGKLHFNNQQHNSQVTQIISALLSARQQSSTHQAPTKRFILRNIDMEFRAYTLTLESPESDNVLLSIQGDIDCCESKLQSITSAFSLSYSEGKIIKLMADGLKPKQIAYELGLSLNTVRSHLRTLYAKMQVSDYNEALTATIKLLA